MASEIESADSTAAATVGENVLGEASRYAAAALLTLALSTTQPAVAFQLSGDSAECGSVRVSARPREGGPWGSTANPTSMGVLLRHVYRALDIPDNAVDGLLQAADSAISAKNTREGLGKLMAAVQSLAVSLDPALRFVINEELLLEHSSINLSDKTDRGHHSVPSPSTPPLGAVGQLLRIFSIKSDRPLKSGAEASSPSESSVKQSNSLSRLLSQKRSTTSSQGAPAAATTASASTAGRPSGGPGSMSAIAVPEDGPLCVPPPTHMMPESVNPDPAPEMGALPKGLPLPAADRARGADIVAPAVDDVACGAADVAVDVVQDGGVGEREVIEAELHAKERGTVARSSASLSDPEADEYYGEHPAFNDGGGIDSATSPPQPPSDSQIPHDSDPTTSATGAHSNPTTSKRGSRSNSPQQGQHDNDLEVSIVPWPSFRPPVKYSHPRSHKSSLVVYELIGSCIVLPHNGRNSASLTQAGVRMYDSRIRVAIMRVCHWLRVAWPQLSALEHGWAQQLACRKMNKLSALKAQNRAGGVKEFGFLDLAHAITTYLPTAKLATYLLSPSPAAAPPTTATTAAAAVAAASSNTATAPPTVQLPPGGSHPQTPPLSPRLEGGSAQAPSSSPRSPTSYTVQQNTLYDGDQQGGHDGTAVGASSASQQNQSARRSSIGSSSSSSSAAAAMGVAAGSGIGRGGSSSSGARRFSEGGLSGTSDDTSGLSSSPSMKQRLMHTWSRMSSIKREGGLSSQLSSPNSPRAAAVAGGGGGGGAPSPKSPASISGIARVRAFEGLEYSTGSGTGAGSGPLPSKPAVQFSPHHLLLLPTNPKAGHSSCAMALTLLVNGFATEPVDFLLPWRSMELKGNERFVLKWDSDVLTNLGKALSAHFSMSSPTPSVDRLVDVAWSAAIKKAQLAGSRLALLLSEGGNNGKPVTLVGFSMGARLIFHCLLELASVGLRGVVEHVVLVGAVVSADVADKWMLVRSVVAGRIINAYSCNDVLLEQEFRSSREGAAGVRALVLPGVENVDISRFVATHLDYMHNMANILGALGLSGVGQ